MTLVQSSCLNQEHLKRHKGFNGMTKILIFRERFRHRKRKVQTIFKAVAVSCQYKIEAEEPLCDVLVEDVLKEDSDLDLDSDMEDMPVSNGESDKDEDE